jgi:hypothetical protein
MTFIPIAIYWIIALWGLFSRRPVLVYLFFLSLPFGSFAVVPPALTGGLTFVPTPMTAMLMVGRTFLDPTILMRAISSALDVRRLGLLTGFIVTALVSTVFMPRLFANRVMVIPVRGDVSTAAPLFPTTQNISQMAYLLISFATVIMFSQILKNARMQQTVLLALTWASALTVATGMLDFASQYLPVAPLLDPFRTATYALLVDVELTTGKRVVGLMPEASSFGSLCLSLLCLLYFMRRAIDHDRVRAFYAPVLCALLIAFAWLSTSSATYLGLAAFFAMAALEWIMRFLDSRYSLLRKRYLRAEFAAAALAVVAVAFIMLLHPAILENVSMMVDRMVFQKTETSSFEERNMWTYVSLNALVETWGLGVGIGGTRASNSAVAAISNVGVIGGIFYFGFIIQSLLRSAPPDDKRGQVLIVALRYAFVPTFLVGLLIGTTSDFGAFGAFRYGMLTAIGVTGLYHSSRMRQRRIAVSPESA